MRAPSVTAAVATALLAVSGSAARADAETDRWVAWHRTRAMLLDVQGRAIEASEEWRVLSVLLPDDPQSAVRAAVSLVEITCSQAVATNRDDPSFKASEGLIREAVRRGALHDPALAFAIGRLRYADGDFESAEKMLGIARRRGFDPARARLWHYRAAIADAKRLIEEAQSGRGGFADAVVRQMEMVLRDYPDHPDALAAKIDLALAWRLRGEHVLAEKALKEAIDKHAWAARLHLTLGQVYGDQGRYEEAEAALRSALERSLEGDDGNYTGPKVYHDALLVIAGLERKWQHYDAAVRYARQLVSLRKDEPQSLALLGEVLADQAGQPGLDDAARRALLVEARDLVRRAYYQLDQGNPAYAKGLARILTELGSNDEAKKVLADQQRLEEARRLR